MISIFFKKIGGKTIFTEDEKASTFMKKLAEKLYLKPHYCFDSKQKIHLCIGNEKKKFSKFCWTKKKKKLSIGPADIEVINFFCIFKN